MAMLMYHHTLLELMISTYIHRHMSACTSTDTISIYFKTHLVTLWTRVKWYTVPSLVEMRPKSLCVTGMFLACNIQGFGTFAMHVCMFCACNMHTTCRDFECFQCMLHVTCIQHYTHNTVTCMFL